MSHERLVERLFEALINGDRNEARAIVHGAEQQGCSPEELTAEVLWPTYEMISRLYRADQLSTLCNNLATRLLRTICDQTAGRFNIQPSTGRSVFLMSGPTDFDEVAGQMASDLLEQAGYEVAFAGGGIAMDELLANAQQKQPDILAIFASAPGDLPMIRELIDKIHEIGACRSLQVVVGGGVFNRADGLAVEIGADLWAGSPMELVEVIVDEPDRRASEDQRTVGRKRTVKAAPRKKAA